MKFEEDLLRWLDIGPAASLTYGIILTIVGSLFMAGGSTLMKLGLHLESVKQKRIVTQPGCKAPTWWIGFSAYSCGAFLHIIALAFAPASVLAPMNSFGLIANAICAVTILNEKLGITDVISTIGVGIGLSLCAFATALPHESAGGSINPYVGINSWVDLGYLTYIGISGVMCFVTLVYITSLETKTLEQFDTAIRRAELSSESAAYGNSLDTRMNDLELGQLPDTGMMTLRNRAQPQFPKLIGVAYGFLAGLIGAQCVLELKELLALVHWSLEPKNPEAWTLPQLYLVSIFFIVSIWLQIHFLNLGLARGDAALVVPTYYVIWTFFGTVGGFTKFHEFQGFSNKAIIIFHVGFCVTIAFVAISAVQEMEFLRRYVEDRIPDIPEAQMDLATQELHDEKLGKQVTLAMGLFPVSLLGRTVGRRRFRPLFHRLRRTRSTASDVGDDSAGMSMDFSLLRPAAGFTLPHNYQFIRQLDE